MLKEMGNQSTSGIVVDAKATESDSCDVEVQIEKNLPMENVSHDEKEAIDGCTNGLPNSTSESEEVIEDHNQSSADLSNILSPEDDNITSNHQEITTSSRCEEKCDTELLVQDRVLRVDSSIDDRVVAHREDGSVETETPSVEGESIEMSAHQGNCDPSCNIENTENCIRNEKAVEDHPKVEMSSSVNTPHDLLRVSNDTWALEHEANDEDLALGETLTANKSSSGANTFYVDQTWVEEVVQGTNDVDEIFVKEMGLVEVKDSVKDETSTEECSSQVGSPLEIKKLNKPEHKPELGHLFPCDILTTEQLQNKVQVLQTNGVESSEEKFTAKSESSLEIEKFNQPDPELDLVFPSRLLVSEPNGGEITVERCGLKSESSLEIKKVDEPVLLTEPELEPGYAFPKQYSVDKPLSMPNPGENIVERSKLASESSSEIKKVSKPEPEIEPRHVFSEQHPGIEKSTLQSEIAFKSECKPKAEADSKQMLGKQYTNNETCTPQTIEKLSIESINPLELRKSPSFDFGLPLASRAEESDQTPLLYQDKTAPRRFSSYIEAVEVEEKTIRMERSTSDVSRSPFLHLSKEEKPENLGVDKDQENGLKSSLLTEECGGISTKRKPRSSLFKTCICCTSPSAFS